MAGRSKAPSAFPTRKWIAARVTAVAGILTMFFLTDGWDAEETVALIVLISEAVVSYLLPNQPDPGGVPSRS